MSPTAATGDPPLARAAVEPRQRLLDGLAAAINDRGYREVTVADVVRHAHTSRRTFYEHFASRDECFSALLFQVNAQLIEHISASVDRSAPWRVQVRQAIEAWLGGSVMQPAITLAWIRDAPALGDPARELQRQTRLAFVRLVEELAAAPTLAADGLDPLPPGLATVLVGGLRELIASQVESGGDIADITETAVIATTAMLQRPPA